MNRQLIEGFEAPRYGLEDIPWLQEDEKRKARWASYFMEQNSLSEDAALNHYRVSKDRREMIRRQTEVLLDNTMSRAKKALHETTTVASDVERFTSNMLALIRKIWPRLYAQFMVSTQVAHGPSVKAFTVDFTAGTAHSPYTTDSSLYAMEDSTYSDDPGEGQEPRQIDFKITSETISVTGKKLKYDYTQEAAQDADAQYGLNLDSELLKMASMQIEREINRVIIDDVESHASNNVNWDTTQPASPDPWANATPKQYAESLWDAIVDCDQYIYESVYQHATGMLCGPTLASRMRKLSSFRRIEDAPGEATGVVGPNLFGTLNATLKLYDDPFFSTDKGIVFHKSDDWMYTGYVYLPWIALWSTPQIWNTKMQPARGLMSRYGLFPKNGDFFCTLTAAAA